MFNPGGTGGTYEVEKPYIFEVRSGNHDKGKRRILDDLQHLERLASSANDIRRPWRRGQGWSLWPADQGTRCGEVGRGGARWGAPKACMRAAQSAPCSDINGVFAFASSPSTLATNWTDVESSCVRERRLSQRTFLPKPGRAGSPPRLLSAVRRSPVCRPGKGTHPRR